MSFERQFLLAGHGLALVGVLALATTGEVGSAYVALASVSILWSLLSGWQGRAAGLYPALANALTVGALMLIVAPVFLQGAEPIRAIAEFLLVLTTVRALAARGNRDWMQIYVLSFFELVSASALTVEPAFALLFLVYLLLAPWALVLFLLRREMSAAGELRRLAEEPFVDPSLFRGVATVTFVLFLSTLAVFVVFPRMGAGFFSNPMATGTALTGFADEVGLGDVSALRKDDREVMRVSLGGSAALPSHQRYWRGAALDQFDGRRWRRGAQELRPLPRAAPGLFLAGEGAKPGTLLKQEIILEPMDKPTLFFLGTPLQVAGRFSSLVSDALGNLRTVSGGGARLRYEMLSSLGPRRADPTPRSRSLPEVDPRIRETAAAQVAGLGDDESRAQALLAYFRKGFRYTLEPGDPGDADPIARFLFETRRGHCEYFASSLAVMLRAVGIPTLVVTGYLGGEWNPYGNYFLVRQAHAHSWVEAYVDGTWRILDPTPPSGLPPSREGRGGLAAMIDAYRMRWYRYVINYSLSDQVELAFSLRDSSRRLRQGLSRERWSAAWRRLTGRRGAAPSPWAALAAIVAVTVLVLSARRWRRERRKQESLAWASRRYLSLLRLLERRGLHKHPAETPDEFCRKIAPRLDGDTEAVERLTALYQAARFSGEANSARQEEIDSLLGRLAERR